MRPMPCILPPANMLPIEPAADMPMSAAAKGNGIELPQHKYLVDLQHPFGNFCILRTAEIANAIGNIGNFVHGNRHWQIASLSIGRENREVEFHVLFIPYQLLPGQDQSAARLDLPKIVGQRGRPPHVQIRTTWSECPSITLARYG